MHIDHVIYATADLDAAEARIRSELGLEVVAGGRHHGLGTHNRIVPLRGGYLELLAVADRDEAAGSPLGAALVALIDENLEALAGWAIALPHVRPVAQRLGQPVTPIARDGMSAQLAGVAEAIEERFLPFFISRGGDDAGLPPDSRDDLPAITWIEVAGDAARLNEWLDDARPPVRVVDGPPGVVAVGVGDRELRPAR